MPQLKELATYAGDRGVVLCVEPLNRFETSFLNLASQAIELVDRVDSPGCGMLLDTFHMNIEERSIGDAIRAAGKRLKHLHACENDRGAPGTGHIDLHRGRRRLPRRRLHRPGGDRVVHRGREINRPRRRHLAPAGRNPGRPGAGRVEAPEKGVRLAASDRTG